MTNPSRTEILMLDVDGILTDGCVYIGSDGEELKRFNIRDGLGIKLCQQVGLEVALISGHSSEATVRRFSRLGVKEIHIGVQDKLALFQAILDQRGLQASQAAAMGDDLVDLPMLRAAGFSATVSGAHAEVMRSVDYVCETPAGHGAVREVIEVILKARGLFEGILARYQA